MTKEKYLPVQVLRPLEICVATILTAIGSFVVFRAIINAAAFISDFVWRLSKGYIIWDMQTSIGMYVIAMAMFAVVCFIFANALFRGHWSRRTTYWTVVTGLTCLVSFIIAFGLYIVGMASFPD